MRMLTIRRLSPQLTTAHVLAEICAKPMNGALCCYRELAIAVELREGLEQFAGQMPAKSTSAELLIQDYEWLYLLDTVRAGDHFTENSRLNLDICNDVLNAPYFGAGIEPEET